MSRFKQIKKQTASALAAVIIGAVSLTPSAVVMMPVANAGQQLGQTDFDDGVGLPWHIVESAPGEMDFEIDNGVYKTTIINPGGASKGGEDRWDCQFRHRGLKIVSGHKYRVQYEITASKSGKYYTKIGNLDGDVEIWHNMSTNDSLIVLANGAAGNKKISAEGPAFDAFKEALYAVCLELAKMLAGDGEGCTALFETKVNGAATKEDARVLAKSVICSSLTKAAIFGHDANWGRILCALGYSGVSFDPDKVDLYIKSDAGRLLLFTNGSAANYSEEIASKILSEKYVTAEVFMNEGNESATAWGCDLTYDYVKINADYRS